MDGWPSRTFQNESSTRSNNLLKYLPTILHEEAPHISDSWLPGVRQINTCSILYHRIMLHHSKPDSHEWPSHAFQSHNSIYKRIRSGTIRHPWLPSLQAFPQGSVQEGLQMRISTRIQPPAYARVCIVLALRILSQRRRLSIPSRPRIRTITTL